MTTITRIKGVEPAVAAKELETELLKKGYKGYATVKDHSINVSQVRLASGHNEQVSQSTKSGFRKTNALSWQDWVNVNETMNAVFDKHKASAKIQSLGGKFKIRDGTSAYHEKDWEDLKYENVGSMISPVQRVDYIRSPKNREIGRTTKFGTISEGGKETITHEIALAKVKSPDPLAYSYGFVQGERGEKVNLKKKGLASEYIRGVKDGRTRAKRKLRDIS